MDVRLPFYRHNPVGKVFSRTELQTIGDLCVKHNIIILSDEVSRTGLEIQNSAKAV